MIPGSWLPARWETTHPSHKAKYKPVAPTLTLSLTYKGDVGGFFPMQKPGLIDGIFTVPITHLPLRSLNSKLSFPRNSAKTVSVPTITWSNSSSN